MFFSLNFYLVRKIQEETKANNNLIWKENKNNCYKTSEVLF